MAEQEMRQFWASGNVRAVDVVEGDVALINLEWREVVDVWTYANDPGEELGEDSELTQTIRRITRRADGTLYTAVRYVHEEDSATAGEIVTKVWPFRSCQLVPVQVRTVPGA
ncbi:hypothetical protein ACIRPQ_29280 [Streptomyces sp. NPDC101213]|uniref:hypothetical protein n=1 Tax=Streptomyces sp. NPDC101213 TaxID=3366130 RepID=UPI0038179906